MNNKMVEVDEIAKFNITQVNNHISDSTAERESDNTAIQEIYQRHYNAWIKEVYTKYFTAEIAALKAKYEVDSKRRLITLLENTKPYSNTDDFETLEKSLTILNSDDLVSEQTLLEVLDLYMTNKINGFGWGYKDYRMNNEATYADTKQGLEMTTKLLHKVLNNTLKTQTDRKDIENIVRNVYNGLTSKKTDAMSEKAMVAHEDWHIVEKAIMAEIEERDITVYNFLEEYLPLLRNNATWRGKKTVATKRNNIDELTKMMISGSDSNTDEGKRHIARVWVKQVFDERKK